LTGGLNVGESREGEGRSREATTTDIVRYIIRTYNDDGINVDQVRVLRASDNLWGVEVLERGSAEPEAFFINLS